MADSVYFSNSLIKITITHFTNDESVSKLCNTSSVIYNKHTVSYFWLRSSRYAGGSTYMWFHTSSDPLEFHSGKCRQLHKIINILIIYCPIAVNLANVVGSTLAINWSFKVFIETAKNVLQLIEKVALKPIK